MRSRHRLILGVAAALAAIVVWAVWPHARSKSCEMARTAPCLIGVASRREAGQTESRCCIAVAGTAATALSAEEEGDLPPRVTGPYRSIHSRPDHRPGQKSASAHRSLTVSIRQSTPADPPLRGRAASGAQHPPRAPSAPTTGDHETRAASGSASSSTGRATASAAPSPDQTLDTRAPDASRSGASLAANDPGTAGAGGAEGAATSGDGPRMTPPRVLATAGMDYPGEAFRVTVRRQDLGTSLVVEGSEGIVALRALVSADGTVGGVEVVASSGSPVLDRTAAGDVRRWRFAPATRAGAPIDAYVTLRIRYVVR